jgi:hypothetical protein
MPIVSRPPEFVVHVRCLHCRHKSLLSNTDLADVGIPPILLKKSVNNSR